MSLSRALSEWFISKTAADFGTNLDDVFGQVGLGGAAPQVTPQPVKDSIDMRAFRTSPRAPKPRAPRPAPSPEQIFESEVRPAPRGPKVAPMPEVHAPTRGFNKWHMAGAGGAGLLASALAWNMLHKKKEQTNPVYSSPAPGGNLSLADAMTQLRNQ